MKKSKGAERNKKMYILEIKRTPQSLTRKSKLVLKEGLSLFRGLVPLGGGFLPFIGAVRKVS